MIGWYPKEKEVLDKLLEEYLKPAANSKKIQKSKQEAHGIVVPHAGYEYSGAIAGKAYALLENSEFKRAVVLGPSHYQGFYGVRAFSKADTPMGSLEIIKNNFENLDYEHSVSNQLPFLKKLGFKEVLPLIIGDLNDQDAENLAGDISKLDAAFIFSTDLSHFLKYEDASKIDKKTINILKNLDLEKWHNLDACGKFPLRVMMHLCKLQGWKPKLLEYKNSGDITGDKNRVVGYASLVF